MSRLVPVPGPGCYLCARVDRDLLIEAARHLVAKRRGELEAGAALPIVCADCRRVHLELDA